jgi:hypothetical protein
MRRMLAATAIALAAVTMSAGAAFATESPRGDRPAGFFGSMEDCLWVGNAGEDEDYWDDYDCVHTEHGYLLIVDLIND